MKKNSKTILCHYCRWGAMPGKLTRCSIPEPPTHINGMHLNVEAARYALPSVAAADGNCPCYLNRDM